MIALRTFFRSLRHALRGIGDTFQSGQNFRVQTMATIVVLAAAVVLRLAPWEIIVVILLCAGVLVLEVVNTIVERLADAVQPRLSHVVREIKDMMAGTVLLASIAAVIVGLLIFGPHIFDLTSGLLRGLTSWLQGVLY